jgi:hypothetical protein
MTQRATIRQARSDGKIGVDVSAAIPFIGTLTLPLRKLPLEQLPSSPYRPEGIAIDDVD